MDAAAPSHDSSDRPLFHLSPPTGRINDPNGLLIRQGTAHVFYQNAPGFPEERNIGWGHASSDDLLNWQIHDMALAPGDWFDLNGCYSGSAVPGISSSQSFFYTGNVKDAQGRRSAHQVLARTEDFLTFTKDPRGPAITDVQRPPGYTAHFRDPMVFEDSGRLRICLGAQRINRSGAILLYTADSVEDTWVFEGELSFSGQGAYVLEDFGYMWECPSLLHMWDHALGRMRHVLIFSPQGAETAGVNSEYKSDVSGYVVGDLEGTELKNSGPFRLLDAGFEYYAPQAFVRSGPGSSEGSSFAKDGDALIMAWLGNPGQDEQPSLDEEGWVHVLSVPRKISLKDGVLHQLPAGDLKTLGEQKLAQISGQILGKEGSEISELSHARSFSLTVQAQLQPGSDVQIFLGNFEHFLVITLDEERICVDRSHTRYSLGGLRSFPRTLDRMKDPRKISLILWHDRSVTEIFCDDGASVFSLRSFLGKEANIVRFASRAGAELGEVVVTRVVASPTSMTASKEEKAGPEEEFPANVSND